jgi:hypothetical protein
MVASGKPTAGSRAQRGGSVNAALKGSGERFDRIANGRHSVPMYPYDTGKDLGTVLAYLAGRKLTKEQIWKAMGLPRSTYYDRLEKGTLITGRQLAEGCGEPGHRPRRVAHTVPTHRPRISRISAGPAFAGSAQPLQHDAIFFSTSPTSSGRWSLT